ncbi:hypothetical protein AAF712_005202 [Marasmius tenuissimus]|uniref:Fungal-type protein kinase domain-containing protein n=1 Tax=Marasmius tenuissimus TaxID=585030 RepID=A0ABR3A331_9AGAR
MLDNVNRSDMCIVWQNRQENSARDNIDWTNVVVPVQLKRYLEDGMENAGRIVSDASRIIENDATRLFVYGMTIEDTRGHLFYFSSSHYFTTPFDLKKTVAALSSHRSGALVGRFGHVWRVTDADTGQQYVLKQTSVEVSSTTEGDRYSQIKDSLRKEGLHRVADHNFLCYEEEEVIPDTEDRYELDTSEGSSDIVGWLHLVNKEPPQTTEKAKAFTHSHFANAHVDSEQPPPSGALKRSTHFTRRQLYRILFPFDDQLVLYSQNRRLWYLV